MFWPFVFINPNEPDNVILGDQIRKYFFSHCIVTGVAFFLTLFFYWENKKSKKGYIDRLKGEVEAVLDNSVDHYEEEEPIPYLAQIKRLFTDSTYICLMLAAGLGGGSFGGLGSNLNTFGTIFGYPEVQIFLKKFARFSVLTAGPEASY
jgi:hypothetical protein